MRACHPGISWWTTLRGSFHAAGWVLALGTALLGCSGSDSQPRTILSAGPQAFEIASSSMAPALLGPCREGICDACGSANWSAAETFRAELPFRCYHCGGQCTPTDRRRPGDHVRVTSLKDTDSIARFGLVAFRYSPESGVPNSGVQVKRVWGLPGERLEIVAGELWIDGQPLRKTLNELKAIAIPVATWPDESPCWRVSEAAIAWQHHRPAAVHPQETPRALWLQASVLDDDYAINQGVSYVTYPVADLLVRVDLVRPLTGSLRIECSYHGQVIVINVVGHDRALTADAAGGQSLVPQQSPRAYTIAIRTHLDIGLCDGRLLLSADDGREEAHLLEASAENDASAWAAPGNSTLSIVTGGEAEIGKLEIARDILLRADRRDAMQSQQFPALPAEHYLLLGDNQPVSLDSRNRLGGVARTQIVGYVVAE